MLQGQVLAVEVAGLTDSLGTFKARLAEVRDTLACRVLQASGADLPLCVLCCSNSWPVVALPPVSLPQVWLSGIPCGVLHCARLSCLAGAEAARQQAAAQPRGRRLPEGPVLPGLLQRIRRDPAAAQHSPAWWQEVMAMQLPAQSLLVWQSPVPPVHGARPMCSRCCSAVPLPSILLLQSCGLQHAVDCAAL